MGGSGTANDCSHKRLQSRWRAEVGGVKGYVTQGQQKEPATAGTPVRTRPIAWLVQRPDSGGALAWSPGDGRRWRGGSPLPGSGPGAKGGQHCQRRQADERWDTDGSCLRRVKTEQPLISMLGVSP